MRSVTVLILALTAISMLGMPTVARATSYEVEIDNFVFTPHGRHIVVGDSIIWRNRDAVTHTATSDNGVFNSGNLNQNQTFAFRFMNAGTFPYHCAVHPSMRDTIFVGAQTGVGNEPISVPMNFELSQNYPNPFNASTLIKYSLSQPAHVRIEIFDVLGQRVSALADGEQSAGVHEVTWNAPDQASGIFFYRVSVDDQSKTGRMVLLK